VVLPGALKSEESGGVLLCGGSDLAQLKRARINGVSGSTRTTLSHASPIRVYEKPVNEMVCRLIHLRRQVDRGGSL
jgi:hypothetical protein